MDASNRSYRWFLEFQTHQSVLTTEIEGIEDDGDRAIYATVILARLILIGFLQGQGWLDGGDRWYLQNKLGQSQQRGPNRFYGEFLQCLGLQGFALPVEERTASTQTLIGQIPYLSSSLFQPHRLERRYSAIAIADSCFETILDWFGDYRWQWHGVTNDQDLNGIQQGQNQDAPELTPVLTLSLLQQSFQYAMTDASGRAYALSLEVIQSLCDRVVEQQILDRITTASGQSFKTLDALFKDLNHQLASRLKHDILPRFRILDPACGSGALLIGAMQTLVPIYEAISPHLPISSPPSPPQNQRLAIKRCILTDNLYGVDISESAIELTRLQLFLHLLSDVKQETELGPLPLIEFNLLPGNALIGLIQVDAEGFDQVTLKGSDRVGTDSRVLQGNLLQPLMAEDYRTIVIEKQISLEDYQAQTRLMAEVTTLPKYVQSEFLRDHIQALNQKAQQKLDQLLLNEFSQKLGIRYRQTQPANGRTHKRILNLDDIRQLQPFHWGYQFHTILANEGGFDVILADLPWGALRATSQQFLSRFRHLAQRKQLDSRAFRRSRNQLLQKDAELAKHWLLYHSQFAYVREYFRRAEQYEHQQTSAAHPFQSATFHIERLFIERCFQLLNSGGTAALFLPGNNAQGLRSGNLKNLLLQHTQLAPTLICANHHQIAPGFSKQQQLGLVRFKKGNRSSQVNIRSYTTAQDSPSPAEWGGLL
ncbi:MAG: hypothetical protein AAF215_32615 [Cyanobacteria bacterium P01_A01_bin.123]